MRCLRFPVSDLPLGAEREAEGLGLFGLRAPRVAERSGATSQRSSQ
jgi:hypothetical protein